MRLRAASSALALAAALLSVLATPCAAAAEETPAGVTVSPDRPDLSDGIQIVPLGHLQVEGGTTLVHAGDTDEASLGEVMVRFPWSERVETRVLLLNYGITRRDGDVRGLLDPSVDLKWKLFDSAETDFGFVLGSTIPIGEKVYRAAHLQPYATLSLDQVLSERVSVTVNLGGSSLSNDAGSFGVLSGGASFAFTVSPRVTTYLEGFGWSRSEPGGPTEQVLDGGVQWLVHARLMLDARVGFGFGRTAADGFIGFGAAYLF